MLVVSCAGACVGDAGGACAALVLLLLLLLVLLLAVAEEAVVVLQLHCKAVAAKAAPALPALIMNL